VLLMKGERLRRPDADVFLPAYDLERKSTRPTDFAKLGCGGFAIVRSS
jgi:hypothetical protein